MVAVDNNFYVIEKSDGVLWFISHDIDRGIIYSISEKKKSLRSGTLLKGAKEGFSVELLPEDVLAIIYKDTKGTLMLYLFNETNWKVYSLIGGEEDKGFNSFYKTIVFNNKLYLFYDLFNEEKGITYLVYHTIDGGGILSSPFIIDELNYRYDLPFSLGIGEDKALYLVYQRHRSNHNLGYKAMQKENSQWTEFKLIDTDINPFDSFSFLEINNSFYCTYLKKGKFSKGLQFYTEKDLKESRNYISREAEIASCTMFIVDNIIWVTWVESNFLFSSYSADNGESFNLPPQGEILGDCKVYKGCCRLKAIEKRPMEYIREVFFIDKGILRAPVIDDLFQVFSVGNSGFYGYCKRNIIDERLIKEDYLKELQSKEELIKSLYNSIEEYRLKIEGYDRKLKAVNSNIELFNKNKKDLNDGVTYLQDSIIEKEKKLNELQTYLLEKEEELDKLKKDIDSLVGGSNNKLSTLGLWSGVSSFIKRFFEGQS